MMTQLDIFEFIEVKPSYPPVINDLIYDIEVLYEQHKNKLPPLKLKNHKYEVWDHVAHLGYRLSIDFWFECEFINNPQKFCVVGAYELSQLFQKELLDQKYKSRGLEISFIYTPTSFHIYTIESKRSKKKEQEEEDE
jgi:hypothetical protein